MTALSEKRELVDALKKFCRMAAGPLMDVARQPELQSLHACIGVICAKSPAEVTSDELLKLNDFEAYINDSRLGQRTRMDLVRDFGDYVRTALNTCVDAELPEQLAQAMRKFQDKVGIVPNSTLSTRKIISAHKAVLEECKWPKVAALDRMVQRTLNIMSDCRSSEVVSEFAPGSQEMKDLANISRTLHNFHGFLKSESEVTWGETEESLGDYITEQMVSNLDAISKDYDGNVRPIVQKYTNYRQNSVGQGRRG